MKFFIYLSVAVLCAIFLSGVGFAREDMPDPAYLKAIEREKQLPLSEAQSQVLTPVQQSPDETPHVYITKGEGKRICQDVYALLILPENVNYLSSVELLKNLSSDERLREWQSARSVYIPKTDVFGLFQQPEWVDVGREETLRSLPEFISDYQGRKYRANSSSESELVLGRDYKIQKTFIDLDQDGTEEQVYRSTGEGYNYFLMDEHADDFVAVHFNKDRSFKNKAQLVLYKEQPVFFKRDMDLATFVVLAQPFKDRHKLSHWNGLSSVICQFSTIKRDRR